MKRLFRQLRNLGQGTAITAVLVGCGSGAENPTSDVKVTNGREVRESEYAATVLLVMETPEGQGICTGTFVNDSQLITAGHCVEGLDFADPAMYYVTQSGSSYKAIAKARSIRKNPSYSIDLGVSPYDVSVVDFAPNTAPATVAIASTSPRSGDTFTIVGYGNNENFLSGGELSGSGAGVKRAGSNRISSVSGGFINFVGVPGRRSGTSAGQLVSSGSGDSGGPLYVNGRLAGITSGGGLRPARDGSYAAVSFYVDLNNSSQRSFLQGALKSRR